MKIHDKPLEPWLIVSDDGSVQSAHCTCMAGLITAVLFALENGTRIAKEASVTGKFASPIQLIRVMNFTSASKKRRTVTARTLPHKHQLLHPHLQPHTHTLAATRNVVMTICFLGSIAFDLTIGNAPLKTQHHLSSFMSTYFGSVFQDGIPPSGLSGGECSRWRQYKRV